MIDKIIKNCKDIGIEFISIDITSYMLNAITLMPENALTNYSNRMFRLSYKSNIIGVELEGFWTPTGHSMITNAELYHDMKYSDNGGFEATKCLFDYDIIQRCIDENFCNNIN